MGRFIHRVVCCFCKLVTQTAKLRRTLLNSVCFDLLHITHVQSGIHSAENKGFEMLVLLKNLRQSGQCSPMIHQNAGY